MLYREISPPPALAPYVRCFWILESCAEFVSAEKEKILPDGCMELIFHYGDRFRRYRHNDSFEEQPRSFIFGQISNYIEIAPTGRIGVLAVRFHPGGAQPFLHMPVHELSNISIGTDEVFGPEGRDLEEKILSSESSAERIRLLCDFLLDRLEHRRDEIAVRECIRQIFSSNGQIPVEKLAAELGISSRQLERKFMPAVGMSPKMLARIARFQNVFRILREQDPESLSELSYEAGYYDQSHFIRDFKEFSGINPRQFFASDHTLSDYFTA